ncbi:dihydroxy-acid dehydratase [Phytohabitans sp. ZYX-F-186]|uniref:Dihydroxy-acid dehydratase n=1 Tax=Phytohabitans maris TaxID=3071409 RepID=A0ABU0ZC56_9ACTN|nr:dihydroxy-acid dehydratase [Phytohabitans sp. ZYX-F-186]MDQ7904649.1 dihydroxy-acid dehydratase [Phytohabitans sp. ZYX-F-186]
MASDEDPGRSFETRRRADIWYRGDSAEVLATRAFLQRGLPDEAFDGRPHIGIVNTASDLSPCNAHLNEVARSVHDGIWSAGGVPMHMPVMSLGEPAMRPTAMMYRNLAAMSVEEMIRANPLDGVVLLGGCDKTIPALLMAAASVDLPAVVMSGGPALTGFHAGARVGCGTDIWRIGEEARAGTVSQAYLEGAMSAMISSRGHCNTMGTASTMACLAEALGMSLPGAAGVPATHVELLRVAHRTGTAAVAAVRADRRPSQIMTRSAFLNAVVVLAAIGGSTNAIVHLLAVAGRLGIDFVLDDFDRAGREVPLIANLEPAGRYLMDDFHRAGGLRAVMREVGAHLDQDAMTVTGQRLGDGFADATIYDKDVVRTTETPLLENGGIAVLRGNLAPKGAVIKPAAASPHLLRHRGPAVVFDGIEDAIASMDDPDLQVDENSVLVLRGCGPVGFPGMPEVGNLPLPRKLLERGVRDMVRISDARMSGTAYGTVVLHVSPEAAAGGPLALVRSGDYVVLDADARVLALDVDEAELAERRRQHTKPPRPPLRGWARLYTDHVLQADEGVDMDFLRGSSGSSPGRTEHF